MSTIAEFRLPAEDTVLAATFDHTPEATIRFESSVSRSIPGLWINGVDREAIEAGLDADPTVDAVELLATSDEGFLYDVTFTDDAQATFELLLADGGALLEARATNGWWAVRMRFRDRDDLCETHERLLEHGVNADVRRVTDLTETTAAHSRLTPEQQEALSAAFEQGYFEIPRSISMEELAGELGISHQALSERLRRAYETLVDEELQPSNDQVNSR